MHSSPLRIGVPGVVALEYRRGLQVSFGAGKHVGDGQGSSRGAVRGSMVVATEAAYTEGKAGNETVGWAQLWSVVDSDGEVGFRGGLTGHWCGFRRRLQLVMDASPAATKCAVGEVRTGWVEAEEFVKDDLELVLCWSYT